MSTEDFERIITPDGSVRILNLLESDPETVERNVMAGPPQVIPMSEVKDFDYWPANVKIKDQNGYGACNGHAAATVAELARAVAGFRYVPLSAWWVYGRLVQGRDRGSNIMDALALCSKEGIAPESTVKYGDFGGRYSAEAVAAASRFRLEIGKSLGQNWEAIVSSVALGRAVNFSLRAGSGFGRLDANGCPPALRGPCNHAVTAFGGIKTLSNGEKLVKVPNSWGVQYGWNGFLWVGRAHVENSSWFEAYEGIAVISDPDDHAPRA